MKINFLILRCGDIATPTLNQRVMAITREDAIRIATEWGSKMSWPYDLIRYAGMEDGFHYVHLDRKVRPRYVGFGLGLEIDGNGNINVIRDCMSINNISHHANLLEDEENVDKK
jgi:hypothetical protein